MLHPVTAAKQPVLTAIQNAADAFKQNNAVVQEKMREAFPDAAQREQARLQIIADLDQAYAGASRAHADPKSFTPRDPMAGIAQSAMNTRAQRSAEPRVAAAGGISAAAAPVAFEQFGPLDPGWIECVIDGFKTLLDGKAPFVQHQNLSDFLQVIPDRVIIALVADWGAHNDAAARVSAQIAAQHPSLVIHLGDIYYAGQDNEAQETLKMWPLADPATGVIPPRTSFALNGNHEMFSGGHAYFGTIFRAFGQQASYFGLRNANWQILAFDSAYIEHRLLPPDEAEATDSRLRSQWDWLVDKMRNSALPTILLSHHQPISAFAPDHSAGQNFRSDLQKFVNAAGRPLFGWFFGHEHRCTIYDPFPNVPFGRLIGHGSIPHPPPPSDQQPDPGCATFRDMNHRANADGDAVSGFALLKFDGSIIEVRYIDEDGTQFSEEVWEAPAAG